MQRIAAPHQERLTLRIHVDATAFFQASEDLASELELAAILIDEAVARLRYREERELAEQLDVVLVDVGGEGGE